MGCLVVEYKRESANLSVNFSLICGTDIGEKMLYDADGARPLTIDGEYLIVN